jgi:hypothetical protein
MMKPAADSYFLTWKGSRTGPFSIEQIRSQLAAGTISRMHRIGVNGGWQLLDEFLTAAPDPAAERHAAVLRQREEQLRREFDSQLAAERARALPPPTDPGDEVQSSPFSHLLPKPPPPPILYPAPPEEEAPVMPTRTSGLAIASLVMALCNFIPYVGFFSWILALVFGHTALGQMQRDPSLAGRGMAIAGLAITYFLLVLGLTFIALVIINHQKLPSFL